MKQIFVDSSAWYALVDIKDPDHHDASSFLKTNRIPLITSNYIFDETLTLIRSKLGHKPAIEFGIRLKASKLTSIVAVTSSDEEKAFEIFRTHADKDFSFTDCTSFAIMQRLNIDIAFAFDAHFRHMKFHLVP